MQDPLRIAALDLLVKWRNLVSHDSKDSRSLHKTCVEALTKVQISSSRANDHSTLFKLSNTTMLQTTAAHAKGKARSRLRSETSNARSRWRGS
jgi:hypothetical protein